MIERQRRGAFFTLLLAAGFAGGAVSAQEDAAGAPLEEAVELRQEANEAAVESQRTIDEIAADTDALLAEYRNTLRQIESIQDYNEQLEGLLASQEEEMASLRRQIEEVAVVGREMRPLMGRMIDALEAFVALDVPFLPEERTQRIAHLRELMARSDVADSEKYRRILESYQIENEFGRTIEAYQGTIETAGVKRTVDFLRIGRVALLYRTLDGEEMGAWNQKKRSWQVLGDEYRIAIRDGLRIARKQMAPDLITLPLLPPEEAR